MQLQCKVIMLECGTKCLQILGTTSDWETEKDCVNIAFEWCDNIEVMAKMINSALEALTFKAKPLCNDV